MRLGATRAPVPGSPWVPALFVAGTLTVATLARPERRRRERMAALRARAAATTRESLRVE
jgi:hypothetical protein